LTKVSSDYTFGMTEQRSVMPFDDDFTFPSSEKQKEKEDFDMMEEKKWMDMIEFVEEPIEEEVSEEESSVTEEESSEEEEEEEEEMALHVEVICGGEEIKRTIIPPQIEEPDPYPSPMPATIPADTENKSNPPIPEQPYRPMTTDSENKSTEPRQNFESQSKAPPIDLLASDDETVEVFRGPLNMNSGSLSHANISSELMQHSLEEYEQQLRKKRQYAEEYEQLPRKKRQHAEEYEQLPRKKRQHAEEYEQQPRKKPRLEERLEERAREPDPELPPPIMHEPVVIPRERRIHLRPRQISLHQFEERRHKFIPEEPDINPDDPEYVPEEEFEDDTDDDDFDEIPTRLNERKAYAPRPRPSESSGPFPEWKPCSPPKKRKRESDDQHFESDKRARTDSDEFSDDMRSRLESDEDDMYDPMHPKKKKKAGSKKKYTPYHCVVWLIDDQAWVGELKCEVGDPIRTGKFASDREAAFALNEECRKLKLDMPNPDIGLDPMKGNSMYRHVYFRKDRKTWQGKKDTGGRRIMTNTHKTDRAAALALNIELHSRGLTMMNPGLGLEGRNIKVRVKVEPIKVKRERKKRKKPKKKKKPALPRKIKIEKPLLALKPKVEKLAKPKVGKKNTMFSNVYLNGNGKGWYGQKKKNGKRVATKTYVSDRDAAIALNEELKELGWDLPNPDLPDKLPEGKKIITVKKEASVKSQYSNVYWCKRRSKWYGEKKFKGSRIRTVLYTSDKDAAISLNKKLKGLDIELPNPDLRATDSDTDSETESLHAKVAPPRVRILVDDKVDVVEDYDDDIYIPPGGEMAYRKPIVVDADDDDVYIPPGGEMAYHHIRKPVAVEKVIHVPSSMDIVEKVTEEDLMDKQIPDSIEAREEAERDWRINKALEALKD